MKSAQYCSLFQYGVGTGSGDDCAEVFAAVYMQEARPCIGKAGARPACRTNRTHQLQEEGRRPVSSEVDRAGLLDLTDDRQDVVHLGRTTGEGPDSSIEPLDKCTRRALLPASDEIVKDDTEEGACSR